VQDYADYNEIDYWDKLKYIVGNVGYIRNRQLNWRMQWVVIVWGYTNVVGKLIKSTVVVTKRSVVRSSVGGRSLESVLHSCRTSFVRIGIEAVLAKGLP